MRSILKLTAVITLTALTLAASGCNGDAPQGAQPMPPDSPSGATLPPTTGPDGEPLPPPAPPAKVASYSGAYDVTAPLDFTQNGVLPGIVSPLLGGLAELHDHPGDALYTILENSNIPYLSDLMMQVPDFLKAGLTAMLDRLIADHFYQGYPIADQVSAIVQGIAEASKYLEVHARLTVHPPGSDLAVKVDQQITAVGFRLFGATEVVPLPASSLAQALAHLDGRIVPHGDAPVADADLSFGSGTYALPVGSLMLQALGPLLFSQFGGAMDLAGALENLVPCAEFGQSLVDQSGGLLTDPTVGRDLCDGALALVAQAVTRPIDALTLDGVVVDGATATLYDVSMQSPKIDYQSDRVADGKWTWHFDVGGAMLDVPSTFLGDRTGPAN